MAGYSRAEAAKQLEVEERLRQLPSEERIREFHRHLTAEPHPAGSDRNNELADYVAGLWKSQGWEDVQIRRYDVLVSEPRSIVVEMVSPVAYRAGLKEDPYEEDPDTANRRVRPGYLALSASGEVTAPVVYAYSGNPEDYAYLKSNGIDVRGKIALVRYSNPYSYRGFKALTAEKLGAAGILIYSDPAEDGFGRGKVFPEGPWGPESHVQRGAITYDFMVAGDPLTPGWASVPGARRIPIEEAVSVPKIIAVPLSWRDARPLLENMDGPPAPKQWQGGLPIQYRLGGSAVRVHMKVEMETEVKPNYVVEARIRGSLHPDEWIILGNHRDAWEFGGVDPSSGTASMLELTRALGELNRNGHRPKRTLLVCSWDGEEVALTGSTEWGEQFADELKEKAVAYINVDSSASGPNFEGSAVASLASVLLEVAGTLHDPGGATLVEAWKRSRKDRERVRGVGDLDLVNVRIGSGSDHTVFLNHLGRPTVGLTFEGPYGVYHSVYDNFYWMNRFGDPGYRYHKLMSQLWGGLALRIANSDVLPMDFVYYADTIGRFVQEVQNQEKGRGGVKWSRIHRALSAFRAAARGVGSGLENLLAKGPPDPNVARGINRRLMRIELNWLLPEGIPGRPWFKHMLYAARYTYAHLELPGLTEAVESGNWAVAREQAEHLEKALQQNAVLLRETVSLMRADGRDGRR